MLSDAITSRRRPDAGRRRPSSPARGTGASSCVAACAIRYGTRVAEQPLDRLRAERLRRERIVRAGVGELVVGDVERARHELLAPRVGHPDHRGVDVEHVDDRRARAPRASSSSERLCANEREIS